MKLIQNTPYSSLFVYFPEIKGNGNWTETNPAVLNHGSSITVPAFHNVSQEPVYFLFKVVGEKEYILSSGSGVNARICLYDYLDYDSSDMSIGSNAIVDGQIGGSCTIKILEKYPVYFLARVSPVGEEDLEQQLQIVFSDATESFETDAHYVRDWQHRIDGTRWNANGKAYDTPCLSWLDRRMSSTGIVKLDAWKHGVRACAKTHPDVAGGTSGLGDIFNGDEIYGTYNSLSFTYEHRDYDVTGGLEMQSPFGHEGEPIATKIECLLYSAASSVASFCISGNGECQVEVAGYSNYFDFSEHSVQYAYGVRLNQGYSQVRVLYNSGKESGDIPAFSIKWRMPEGACYDFIPASSLFLPNGFSVDEYIPFESIFDSSTIMQLTSSVTVSADMEYGIDVGSKPDGFTVGMLLRFPSGVADNARIFSGRGLEASLLNGGGVLRLSLDGMDAPIDLLVVSGKWHSLFIVADNTMLCWYWDLNTNGIRNTDNSGICSTQSQIVLGGSDGMPAGFSFETSGIIVSSRMFRQAEINRLYQNSVASR